MRLLLAFVSVSFLFVGVLMPSQQPIAASETRLWQGADGPRLPSLAETRDYYRHLPPVQKAWTIAVGLFALVGWGALLLYGVLRMYLWLFLPPGPILIPLRTVWLISTGVILILGSVIRAIVSDVYADGDLLASIVVVLVGLIALLAGTRLKRRYAGFTPQAAAAQK